MLLFLWLLLMAALVMSNGDDTDSDGAVIGRVEVEMMVIVMW